MFLAVFYYLCRKDFHDMKKYAMIMAALLTLAGCTEKKTKMTAELLENSMWTTAKSMVDMKRLAFGEGNELIAFTTDNSKVKEEIGKAFRCTYTFDEDKQTVTLKLVDCLSGDSTAVLRMVDGKTMHLNYDGHDLTVDGEVTVLNGEYFKANHDHHHHHH